MIELTQSQLAEINSRVAEICNDHKLDHACMVIFRPTSEGGKSQFGHYIIGKEIPVANLSKFFDRFFLMAQLLANEGIQLSTLDEGLESLKKKSGHDWVQ